MGDGSWEMGDGSRELSEAVEVKPLLALDVDGPIVLMGAQEGDEVFEAWAGEIPVTIARQLPARLLRLSAAFQVVWSTSWGRKANLHIAPLVGLPATLPVIEFDRFPRAKPGETRKLPGLQAWLKAAPAAIVDDEVGQDLLDWAARRTVPTLVVEIDPRHGILDVHVERLLAFAREGAGGCRK